MSSDTLNIASQTVTRDGSVLSLFGAGQCDGGSGMYGLGGAPGIEDWHPPVITTSGSRDAASGNSGPLQTGPTGSYTFWLDALTDPTWRHPSPPWSHRRPSAPPRTAASRPVGSAKSWSRR